MLHRAIRPACGALAAIVPSVLLNDEQQFRKLRQDRPNWVCAGTSNVFSIVRSAKLAGPQYSHCSAKPGVTLTDEESESIARQSSIYRPGFHVTNNALHRMWDDLLRWYHSSLKAIGKEDAGDGISIGLLAELGGMAAAKKSCLWVVPMLQWTADPKTLQRADYDGNGYVHFQEFAILYILALSSVYDANGVSYKRTEGVERTTFIDVLFNLMDLNGSGGATRQEFIHVSSLLAVMGLIKKEPIEALSKSVVEGKGSEKTKVQQNKDKRRAMYRVGDANIKATLKECFYSAYDAYDKDGNRNMDYSEWVEFFNDFVNW